jgi:all-trans-8'-apo-beta-carotenal 15,15'-oxygenase
MHTQTHSINGLNYAHDFALTEHYYVVHQTPFVKIDTKFLMKVGTGVSGPGQELRYYPELPCALLLIPRRCNHPTETEVNWSE